tara:strand:- start:4339 stop:4647 length:309 start_codon:yes stop_codon:yes gene_type:complete
MAILLFIIIPIKYFFPFYIFTPSLGKNIFGKNILFILNLNKNNVFYLMIFNIRDMEIIRTKKYKVCSKVDNSFNQRFEIQMVMNSIHIYMSKPKLHHLVKMI